jgi:hypothetical protein
MTIQEKCDQLNRDIHDTHFNEYLLATQGNYERVFTSIDVVGDCQNAIEEFIKIPDSRFKSRSTLYIYGVLQSMYCQQDGLRHLYNTVRNENLTVYELFSKYNFDKQIREVRDDIAGHPSNRKGNEFYFIGKGRHTKYNFSYAGYTPKFKQVDVDLKRFIDAQNNFTNYVLDDVEKLIFDWFQIHKNKF